MRLVDALLAVIIVILAAPIFLLALLIVRRLEPATRSTIVSLTADSIADTSRLNTPDTLAQFYGRDPFVRTSVVHTGDRSGGARRLAPGIIGVELSMCLPQFVERLVPLTTRMWLEISSIPATIRLMRRLGSDVLEVMSPSAMVPRALLIQLLTGCRLTTQVRGNIDLLTHSLGTYFYCRIRTRWLLPRLFAGAVHRLIAEGFYRRCDLVVGYNLNNLQSAISNGADPTKSRLARISIDQTIMDAPVRPRTDLPGFPQSGRVILLWSRLGPEKYVAEALEAFIALAATHADVAFVIVGDGPLRETLEARSRAAGVADRVAFLGFRDRAFIRSAAAYADVALVPYGGSSLVEAILLDLPVVAFDVEWHAELVRPGETGFLADFPDAHHMAAQLTVTLDNPDEAKRMARACRVVADRMFDPDRVRANERRIYSSLVRAPAA